VTSSWFFIPQLLMRWYDTVPVTYPNYWYDRNITHSSHYYTLDKM